MKRAGIGLTIGGALVLVAFSLVARTSRPTVEAPRLVSMAEGAQALARASDTWRVHAQAMLREGQRTGDQDSIARGEHWLRDSQDLEQRSRWLAMNPTAPGSLLASPSELATQGNWGELTRTAQAMLHDPEGARSAVDLEALRWNGLAMRAEGRLMSEHGRIMAEEAEIMVERHGLEDQAADDLRQAAMSLQQVGGYLERNGQAMIDYADRLRRSLGYGG